MIQYDPIYSYKLSIHDKHALYGFTIAMLNDVKYKTNPLSLDNQTLFYYAKKIFSTILPNSTLYTEFNDILSNSDLFIIFNSDKDLTLFLLTKDIFFNHLQYDDYTSLGLNSKFIT